jgi:hypothetical protein
MGEATRRVLRLFWSPRGLAEAALMWTAGRRGGEKESGRT